MTAALDGEFGVDYQLTVLTRMAEELPPSAQKHFVEQINSVRKAIDKRDSILSELLRSELDTLRVNIAALQFDLEATRRERDARKK